MREDAFSHIVVNGPFTDELHPLQSTARLTAKRLFDLTAAIVLLVITLPIFVFIASLLMLSGQWPLFEHSRVGRGGRRFGCLKFRSMCRNADVILQNLLERDPRAREEWESHRKLRNDPRVTRLGKILRSTSLDEIPQLFNIIFGHMSFVGPRPVTTDEFEKFYRADAAAAYLSVRPGLTGPWQVSGRSETDYAVRVALDTRYARHISLRRDIVILFRTVGAIVRQKGAW